MRKCGGFGGCGELALEEKAEGGSETSEGKPGGEAGQRRAGTGEWWVPARRLRLRQHLRGFSVPSRLALLPGWPSRVTPRPAGLSRNPGVGPAPRRGGVRGTPSSRKKQGRGSAKATPGRQSPGQLSVPDSGRRRPRAHTPRHAPPRAGTKTRAPTLHPEAAAPHRPAALTHPTCTLRRRPGTPGPHGRAGRARAPRAHAHACGHSRAHARPQGHRAAAAARSHRLPRVPTATPRSVAGGGTGGHTTP